MSFSTYDAKLLGETLAHMAYVCVKRQLARNTIYWCGEQQIEFDARMVDNELVVRVSEIREIGKKELFTADRGSYYFTDYNLSPISTKIQNFAKAFVHEFASRV